MGEVTRMIEAIERGEKQAAADLLPLVYEELRQLAAHKLSLERPGQTLQATALVHEAWLRLVGDEDPSWDGRGHFFAAAAEAMRRILVESARRKQRVRHGGGLHRVDVDEVELACGLPSDKLLAVNEALIQLEQLDPQGAQIVKLRFFAGLTHPQIASALGVSLSTVERSWAFSRVWLFRKMRDEADGI
ncbi:MAG TPA: sigma-70 family RNA polymerase sigma factor [Verrucomicrobiota bacterium]|nr:sigma-70 family RNA polymerase sigma factor [Verrucomicrobiota bacterium]